MSGRLSQHPDLCPADRVERAQQGAVQAGLDALLISPGADLRYLTGYAAHPLERLTCLVVPARGEPFLVVPLLEKPSAAASPAVGLGIEIVGWAETEDPYALIAKRLGGSLRRVGLDKQMWAEQVLAFQRSLPSGAELDLAGGVLGEMRMRKSPAEVEALRKAGAAIDRVHSSMGEWLRVGRTEREVARDIADAILAEHATVDFVIVASGPNSASPHHETSDRVIGAGEPVVVDIGGTTQDGYCSDSTRNYCVGGRPDAGYQKLFEVLLAAQRAQCEAAGPGITSGRLDAVGRTVIADAGYGEYFVHRTGHGIGLETHEEPYIVAGSAHVLEPGMTFSIEPGIYVPGRYGARIEDIVVCNNGIGAERLNGTPRDLVQL
ncbi:Xaa-Pro peptidase family protein [Streptomyces sp. NPDC002082]|uniref:M24 family metallopeptidase n=1 Tax=Streptomyces sp. NPDC002082 TaxID=3154772 RepID=UPI00332BF5A9